MGRELREARLALGLRQADVGRAAGISPSWVSRIERQEADEVGFRLLCVLAAIVGLDISVRAYPGGSPLRDAGHREVLARVRRLLPAGTPWAAEVPFPAAGDQRAWDAKARVWDVRVGIEVEMRATDVQAMERRIMLKARDGAVDRVVLALPNTRHNRRLLRDEGDSLRGSFPIQGHAALALLTSPVDPGANLLLLV